MNKPAINKIIHKIKQRTIISDSNDSDAMTLLLLYLFDWKYILVYEESILNIKWKVVDHKITFAEFSILNAEGNYALSEEVVYHTDECALIWLFIATKLDKYPTLNGLVSLVKSTYPFHETGCNNRCIIDLVSLSAKYKETLNVNELIVIESASTSVFARFTNMFMHYYNKLKHINFTNVDRLYDTIDKLKADINLYKYDYNTGLMTRHDLMIRLNVLFDNQCDFVLVMYDINGLHTINRLEGYRAGDALIVKTARNIEDLSGNHESYTTGGDEFFVIYEDHSEVPDDIEVDKTCSGAESSSKVETISELIDIVDQFVTDKKRHIKKRRDDI